MNELSSNLINQQKTIKPEQNVETAGSIALNKPTSGLFSVQTETAGSIASSNSSSGGNFCANA